MLVVIKIVHTIVWAFTVACILGIDLFSGTGRFGPALVMIGIVFGEVLVLFVERMRCPLNSIAGRFTEERRPNFDIDPPAWFAKCNEEIFAAIGVGGIVYTAFMGIRSPPLAG